MSAAPTIRRGTIADAAGLATFDARRLGRPAEALQPLISSALERGRDAVWLAEEHGAVVGYAKAHWVCPATQAVRAPGSHGVRAGFHLMGLEVAPEHRREGIGTALTQARLDWCRERGATEVFYVTRTDNDASIALHAALGFEPDGEASYDGDATSRVERLALSPELPLHVHERPAEANLSTDDVVALYDAVGWSVYTADPHRLLAGIQGSSWLATRWSGERLVALCRVVTDGVSIAYLQDILIDPAYQRRGLGRGLARLALDRFDGVRQFVLLTDDRPTQRAFYTSLGLKDIDGTPLRCFARMPGL